MPGAVWSQTLHNWPSVSVGLLLIEVDTDPPQFPSFYPPPPPTTVDVPTIITDPYDVINVIPGHNVTFSLRATGLRLTYTWQQGDGRALPNNSRFITNNETLIIQEVMLSDPNSYRCVVTNAAGNATSISANFTFSEYKYIGNSACEWLIRSQCKIEVMTLQQAVVSTHLML